VLIYLINVYKNYGIKTPDLRELLDDPSKATQSNIQSLVYGMLNQLDDQKIQEIKYPEFKIGSGMKLDTFLSKDISKISKPNQCCIIYTSTPVKTALNNYRQNFGDDIFERINIKRIINDCIDKQKKHEKEMERLQEKRDEGAVQTNKLDNTKEKFGDTSAIKLLKLQDQIPTWDFPSKYQICSEAHLREYKCEPQKSFNMAYTDMPADSNVSDEVLTLLASGIGIYDTSDESLDKAYLEAVLFLAKKKLLKAIYSNNSIAYGTNLSVTDCIINDTTEDGIVDEYSMNTFFQKEGRA
jgi:hypothetical protein